MGFHLRTRGLDRVFHADKGPAMSRYNRSGVDIATSKRALWKFGRQPAFKYKLAGSAKVKACYDQCHLAWRAGLIDSWYYGRRSPCDPTVVWEINGHELTLEEVMHSLERRRTGHNVASIAWGATWVGYRSVIVTSTSGETIRQHYDPVVARVCYETAEHGTEALAASA